MKKKMKKKKRHRHLSKCPQLSDEAFVASSLPKSFPPPGFILCDFLAQKPFKFKNDHPFLDVLQEYSKCVLETHIVELCCLDALFPNSLVISSYGWLEKYLPAHYIKKLEYGSSNLYGRIHEKNSIQYPSKNRTTSTAVMSTDLVYEIWLSPWTRKINPLEETPYATVPMLPCEFFSETAEAKWRLSEGDPFACIRVISSETYPREVPDISVSFSFSFTSSQRYRLERYIRKTFQSSNEHHDTTQPIIIITQEVWKIVEERERVVRQWDSALWEQLKVSTVVPPSSRVISAQSESHTSPIESNIREDVREEVHERNIDDSQESLERNFETYSPSRTVDELGRSTMPHSQYTGMDASDCSGSLDELDEYTPAYSENASLEKHHVERSWSQESVTHSNDNAAKNILASSPSLRYVYDKSKLSYPSSRLNRIFLTSQSAKLSRAKRYVKTYRGADIEDIQISLAYKRCNSRMSSHSYRVSRGHRLSGNFKKIGIDKTSCMTNRSLLSFQSKKSSNENSLCFNTKNPSSISTLNGSAISPKFQTFANSRKAVSFSFLLSKNDSLKEHVLSPEDKSETDTKEDKFPSAVFLSSYAKDFVELNNFPSSESCSGRLTVVTLARHRIDHNTYVIKKIPWPSSSYLENLVWKFHMISSEAQGVPDESLTGSNSPRSQFLGFTSLQHFLLFLSKYLYKHIFYNVSKINDIQHSGVAKFFQTWIQPSNRSVEKCFFWEDFLFKRNEKIDCGAEQGINSTGFVTHTKMRKSSEELKESFYKQLPLSLQQTTGRLREYEFCIQTEYFPGVTLRESILRGDFTNCQPMKIWSVFRQILEAFFLIHQLGLSHLALHPGNIFFHSTEQNKNLSYPVVKLSDYGIHKLILRETFWMLVWGNAFIQGNAENLFGYLKNFGKKKRVHENYHIPLSEEFQHLYDKLVEKFGTYVSNNFFGNSILTQKLENLYQDKNKLNAIQHHGSSSLPDIRAPVSFWDQKCDIFSLGLLLFELFHEPFRSELQRHDAIRSISTRDPKTMLQLLESIRCVEARKLILKLTDPDPCQRPTASYLLFYEPLVPSHVDPPTLKHLLYRLSSPFTPEHKKIMSFFFLRFINPSRAKGFVRRVYDLCSVFPLFPEIASPPPMICGSYPLVGLGLQLLSTSRNCVRTKQLSFSHRLNQQPRCSDGMKNLSPKYFQERSHLLDRIEDRLRATGSCQLNLPYCFSYSLFCECGWNVHPPETSLQDHSFALRLIDLNDPYTAQTSLQDPCYRNARAMKSFHQRQEASSAAKDGSSTTLDVHPINLLSASGTALYLSPDLVRSLIYLMANCSLEQYISLLSHPTYVCNAPLSANLTNGFHVRQHTVQEVYFHVSRHHSDQLFTEQGNATPVKNREGFTSRLHALFTFVALLGSSQKRRSLTSREHELNILILDAEHIITCMDIITPLCRDLFEIHLSWTHTSFLEVLISDFCYIQDPQRLSLLGRFFRVFGMPDSVSCLRYVVFVCTKEQLKQALLTGKAVWEGQNMENPVHPFLSNAPRSKGEDYLSLLWSLWTFQAKSLQSLFQGFNENSFRSDPYKSQQGIRLSVWRQSIRDCMVEMKDYVDSLLNSLYALDSSGDDSVGELLTVAFKVIRDYSFDSALNLLSTLCHIEQLFQLARQPVGNEKKKEKSFSWSCTFHPFLSYDMCIMNTTNSLSMMVFSIPRFTAVRYVIAVGGRFDQAVERRRTSQGYKHDKVLHKLFQSHGAAQQDKTSNKDEDTNHIHHVDKKEGVEKKGQRSSKWLLPLHTRRGVENIRKNKANFDSSHQLTHDQQVQIYLDHIKDWATTWTIPSTTLPLFNTSHTSGNKSQESTMIASVIEMDLERLIALILNAKQKEQPTRLSHHWKRLQRWVLRPSTMKEAVQHTSSGQSSSTENDGSQQKTFPPMRRSVNLSSTFLTPHPSPYSVVVVTQRESQTCYAVKLVEYILAWTRWPCSLRLSPVYNLNLFREHLARIAHTFCLIILIPKTPSHVEKKGKKKDQTQDVSTSKNRLTPPSEGIYTTNTLIKNKNQHPGVIPSSEPPSVIVHNHPFVYRLEFFKGILNEKSLVETSCTRNIILNKDRNQPSSTQPRSSDLGQIPLDWMSERFSYPNVSSTYYNASDVFMQRKKNPFKFIAVKQPSPVKVYLIANSMDESLQALHYSIHRAAKYSSSTL